jgi:hypothetical protein
VRTTASSVTACGKTSIDPARGLTEATTADSVVGVDV